MYKTRMRLCFEACEGIPTNALIEASKCYEIGKFGTMAAVYKSQLDKAIELLKFSRELLPLNRNDFKSLTLKAVEAINSLIYEVDNASRT